MLLPVVRNAATNETNSCGIDMGAGALEVKGSCQLDLAGTGGIFLRGGTLIDAGGTLTDGNSGAGSLLVLGGTLIDAGAIASQTGGGLLRDSGALIASGSDESTVPTGGKRIAGAGISGVGGLTLDGDAELVHRGRPA